MDYQSYLMHFNPNRDPRNGQFAKGHGNSLARAEVNAGRKMLTAGQKIKQNITSKRGKKVLKTAAIVGGVAATSALVRAGIINSGIKWLTNGEYHVPLSSAIGGAAYSAGRAALISGLAVGGFMKMKDLINRNKEPK